MLDFVNMSVNNFFAFTLTLIRISGLFVVSPFFGGDQVPKRIRIFIVLGLAMVVFPTLNTNISALPSSGWQFLIIVIKELSLGMMIGFMLTAIFFGFEMGGRFVSIHMGLSMARMLDPFSGQQTAVIGQFIGLIVMTAFLVMNGHHWILKALMESFRVIPLMGVKFNNAVLSEAVKTFNVVIVASIKIAMPMMGALFAINLIFGFIARLVPKMNVFILSLPVKIAVGVFLIMVSLPAILYLLVDVLMKVFQDIFMIIRALG